MILDCSTLLPGPLMGKLLAQNGCEVIKVESSKRPDPARLMGSGAYYRDLNSMKRLADLDLSAPVDSRDRMEFNRLLLQADGLVEAYRPETKIKLGLTQERLHSINPRLVIVSITGYPESSPLTNRPAHDLNFQALSGSLSMSRDMPALPLADLVGAYDGALAMLSAIQEARSTGRGKRVVISLLEAMKNAQSKWVAEYRDTGAPPRHGETLVTGKYPCYRIYQARCGRRIAVGAIEAKYWNRLVAIIGLPELVDLGMSSGAQGEEVARKLALALESKTWEEWSTLIGNADCCVDPVLDYPEIYGRV